MLFMAIAYAAELLSIIKYMRGFFPKLFELRGKIWILYGLGAVVSRLILRLGVPQNKIVAVTALPKIEIGDLYSYYLVIIASAWCFVSVILTIVFARRRVADGEELQSSQRALNAAIFHYNELSDSLSEAAAMRHDMKYTLSAISELAVAKDWEAIAALLSQTQIELTPPLRFCSHGVADALLSFYDKRLRAENIAFEATVSIPADIPIESSNLCVLIGNLLENARTAVHSVEGNRYISLRTKTEENMLALIVENSFDGKVLQKDGKLKSTKKNGGQGINSVSIICEKYGGEFIPSFTEDTFTALAMLYW
jgi:hypothetical protein